MLNANGNHNPQENDFLQAAIDAVRRDAPSEAQWQQARRNLAERIQQPKETFIMNVIKLATTKQSRWTFATACVALIAVFALVFGPGGSGSLAFAEVLERILAVRSVAYTLTVEKQGQPAVSLPVEYLSTGVQRVAMPDGIQIMDHANGRILNLDTKEKKAILLTIKSDQQDADYSFISMMKILKDQSDESLGEKEIDGQTAVGFHLIHGGRDFTVWADPETGLPVRMIIIMNADVAFFDSTTITFSDFVFNPDLDESLFSSEVPEGYELIEMPAIDMTKETTEADLIETFRQIVTLSDGQFPKTLSIESIMELLKDSIELKNDDDIKKYGAFFAGISRGLMFVQLNAGNDWHYESEGIKFGDTQPLCWWKPKGAETYRVIYGDLKTADVRPDEFVTPEK